MAASLLAGCSTLLPDKRDPAAGEATSTDAAIAYTLRIDAPAELSALLERFLDLSRFRRSAGADDLTALELDRLVAASPAQARTLLETEGYFNAEVRVERPAARELRIVVEPGARTRVGRVTIEAQGALQEAVEAGDASARATLEALRRGWSLAPDQPFRQTAWSDAKNALLARLRAAGYASATYSGTSATIDAATNRARLLVIADSGPLFRIGELRIDGLQRHDERSVRNLAGFGPGAVATEERLLDFQERLQTASLFEGVSVDIDADPAVAAATPVRVRVRELPLQQATAGVGVSANTGPRVSLEHLHRRPFGWAARSHNKIEIGRDRRAWEGELSTHQLPGLYRNLVSGSLERLATADEVRSSWSARVGRAQDTPHIERLYYVEALSSTVTTALTKQRGDALWANYLGTWRELDNLLLPTRGATLAAQGGGGQARSNFAQSGPFGRLSARLTGYYPFGGWYGQARVEAGQVFAADRVGLPDTLLFRAGGDDSVRGYSYRTLGPVVNGIVTSGRVIGTASVEFARPLSERLSNVWGAVFVDAGNAADSWRDFNAALGYGVGVRLRSPIGPLRIDIAYGDEIRKLRLHFSVGVAL